MRSFTPRRRRFAFQLLEPRRLLASDVVINEIHFNPADSQSRSEFVELFNAGDSDVDLSGWLVTDGIQYRVPQATTLPAGGYYLIAENAADFDAAFNPGSGPFVAYEVDEGTRGLQNFGGAVGMDFVVNDEITLVSLGAFDSNSDGFERTITVQLWERDDRGTPNTPADDAGLRVLAEHVFSAEDDSELIQGSRFSELPQPLQLGPGAYTIVASGYGVGERLLNGGAAGAGDVNDASGRISFVGSSRWGDSVTSFPNNIDVHQHQYGAGTFQFDFEQDAEFHAADGVYSGKLSNEGETITLRRASGAIVDSVTYRPGFPWPTAAAGGGPSMELVHPALDNDLGGSWRSAGNSALSQPTPGKQNGAYAINSPPQIRQVQVIPEQPQSGDVVRITAKVTDLDRVSAVTLYYQAVQPGDYVPKSDPRYETDWVAVMMHDDGRGVDGVANDAIYSAYVPAEVQQHRHLIRYRIEATDGLGSQVRVPFADDAQSNFAYFVYDGIPAWTGADRPGVTDPVTYDTDVTRSLPAMHLISRESDVISSNYNTRYNTNDFRFEGTLVVDGKIYDHIRYRIRGQNSTYVSGKNKWKLKFNRGHEFQGYDQYGNPWPTKLGTLNLGTAASPWAPGNRGLAGMDEALAFELFNRVGVAAPRLSPFQLRVIDGTEEASADNQYEGDLWGLYLAFENPSGDFLRSHELPDGNLFRMQNTASELENHGYGLPGDLSDLNEFTSTRTGYNRRTTQPVEWWRDNVDLEGYYRYRSVVEAINHSDIRDKENMLLYFNPDTARWSMLPWDVDLLFEEFDRWGPNGVQNASALEQFRKALEHETLRIEFQNVARDLQDLLLNEDQGATLVEEYARYVEPFAAIDRAMWDYNPRSRQAPANGQHYGAFYREVYRYPAGNGAAGEVRRAIDPVGFEGMVNWVKDFISPAGFGGGRLSELADDPDIPQQPSLRYVGNSGFSADSLTFRATEFSDPQGDNTFSQMEWRLGRVRNPDTADFQQDQRWLYEVDEVWSSGELDVLDRDITIPSTAVAIGSTYRARVRYQDVTGRWSHWSAPVEFVAGAASLPDDPGLRISEIHYHPAEPTASEIAAGFDDSDDFEFLELLNVSNRVIDLTTVELRRTSDGEGVAIDFADGDVTELPPGQRVIVVEDADAFRLRYGAATAIAGQWSGGLSNGGELLQLFINATLAFEMTYDDAWYPVTDGQGYSLELNETSIPAIDQLSSATSWHPSSRLGGSPGSASDARMPGDSNGDGRFDSSDLVYVFQIGEYEDDVIGNSTFEDGDWNGDGDFTTSDLVLVFQQANYAAAAEGIGALENKRTRSQ